MKKQLIEIFGVTVLASSLCAVEFDSGQSGNWGTGIRWSSDVEPTNTQDAFIRSGTQHVYVTLDDEVANRLTLGQSGSNSTLSILSGSLELTGDGSANLGQLYMSWGGVGDTTGIVNLSGGSLTALGYATNTNDAGDIAQLNISGDGIFDLNGHFTAGGGHVDADDSVNVTGSSAGIDISNSATFGANSELSFLLDGGGASTFFANRFTANAAADLVIDFGTYAYSGSGTDKIMLVDSSNLSAFDVSNISYLNDAGFNYTLVQDTVGSGDIYLNIIPEPGTYALLGGLLALSYVMLRRRKA